MFLIALFRVKTVNLTELATGFMGQAQTDSHHKRLQRFFRSFELNYYEIAKVIVGLMNIPEPWVLSLDRTDWQFGQTTFNILTLGIVHGWGGVSRPVVDVGSKGQLQHGRADRVDGGDRYPVPRT